METRKGLIYRITCSGNGKVYIGQCWSDRTRLASYRKARHFSNLRHNKHVNQHLQNAWNKYGEEAFTFEVLVTLDNVTLDEMNALEVEYIEKYDSFHNGFNKTVGGDGTKGRIYVMPESTKQKIREAKKEISSETRALLSKARGNRNFREGTNQSEETKKKIGAANAKANSTLTEEKVIEIIQLLEQGVSQRKAAAQVGVTHKVVWKMLRSSYWSEHPSVKQYNEKRA